MGSIIKGVCNNCRYESKDFYSGGSLMNFTPCCNYPVLDKEENEIKMADIKNRKEAIKQNPNILFYDNKSLSDRKLQNRKVYHEIGGYKLYSEGYLCPKCRQFTLRFDIQNYWD